jgi:hypothetical protein
LLERLEIARAIRSKKILPLLVKHIGWTNEIYLESVTGNPDPDKMYPVYVALKAYGSDANDVLFGEIKKGGAIRDQGEWQNQAHAIIYFLISQSDIREIGREIAKKRIEHELRNAKHESECLRLRALLESQLLK